jgi:mRNA interferase MazF
VTEPLELAPGDLVWVAPDATVGREQSGRRPAVVVASVDYLATVDMLAIVVPVTSVDRGWPNHVPITGSLLPQPSWAMTEQVRTISRERVVDRAGRVPPETLVAIRVWIRDFLGL